MHGGTNPGPPVQHGRYSKHLPERLATRYEEALQDAELVSVSHEIALLDVRLTELLQKIETTESSVAWGQALELFQEIDHSYPARQRLHEVLKRGAGEVANWIEIARVVEQRRRLAETEAKRLSQLDQNLTAKQANVLIAALLAAVNEHVRDTQVRQRIASRFVQIVHHEDRAGASVH